MLFKKKKKKDFFCLLYYFFAPGETVDRRKAQNPQRGSRQVGVDCLLEQNQYLFSCCHVSSLCWDARSSGMLPGFITMCQKVTGYLLQMCSPLWIPLIHVAQMAFAYLLKACLVFTQ